MKIYKKNNVYDEALNRIRYIFDEFPNVVVGVSGGKDSTVVFNLAMIVAKEKGRLPLRVLFLDQEAEWSCVIDHVRNIMYHPDVKPMWFQMPLVLFNATSATEHWLECWKEGADWMREKEPIAITENVYGTNRFAELFGGIFAVEFAGQKACYISGVRAEETPTRFIGLTGALTYKWITWGKVLDKKVEHYTFYPIYDWHGSDVWKSIYDNDWDYCKLYDYMYSYGVPYQAMRVSNVHHETAVRSLFYMQEIEPETYEKLTERIAGIDMAGKLGKTDYFVKDLPFMFSSWTEYRDYLLEHLIDEQWHKSFKRDFDRQDKLYSNTEPEFKEKVIKTQISSILSNDWEHIKTGNFDRRPANRLKAKGEAAYKLK